MSEKDSISYEPIPQPGGGKVCLTIYRPGTFFGRDGEFAVMVGGCGWGRRKTLREAKIFLLECARAYCTRQIEKGQAMVDYYSGQRDRLNILPPQVKGE